jgi:hypothetical protein
LAANSDEHAHEMHCTHHALLLFFVCVHYQPFAIEKQQLLPAVAFFSIINRKTTNKLPHLLAAAASPQGRCCSGSSSAAGAG